MPVSENSCELDADETVTAGKRLDFIRRRRTVDLDHHLFGHDAGLRARPRGRGDQQGSDGDCKRQVLRKHSVQAHGAISKPDNLPCEHVTTKAVVGARRNHFRASEGVISPCTIVGSQVPLKFGFRFSLKAAIPSL